MFALSVKQPLAWLIVNGYKKEEFRSWKPYHLGRILIHASTNTNKEALVEIRKIVPRVLLLKGGVIGSVHVTDFRWDTKLNCWCWGLSKPETLPFLRIPGKVGLFSIDDSLLGNRLPKQPS